MDEFVEKRPRNHNFYRLVRKKKESNVEPKATYCLHALELHVPKQDFPMKSILIMQEKFH